MSDTGMSRKAGKYLGDIYLNMGIIATSAEYDAQNIEALTTYAYRISMLFFTARGFTAFEEIECAFRELRDDTEDYVCAIGNTDTVGELPS